MKKHFLYVLLCLMLLQMLPLTASAASTVSNPVEQQYQKSGPLKAKYKDYPSGEKRYSQYRIWYPANMSSTDSKYPALIIANGTGCGYKEGMTAADAYVDFCKHLVSWGFIVVANDEGNSGTGESTTKSLDFLLSQNYDDDGMFHSRIAVDKIGVYGHSQGAIGAMNAASYYENSYMYKSVCCASAPINTDDHGYYNPSLISAPILHLCGDGSFEQEEYMQAPTALKKNYADSRSAFCALRKNSDHMDIFTECYGYTTAWFRYTLCGDSHAAKAFTGETPELKQNKAWKSVKAKKLPACKNDPASLFSIADCTIKLGYEQYTYTGKARKASVKVKSSSAVLQPGIDYTRSYSNCVVPGTATLTIKGIGAYTGKVSKTYQICLAVPKPTATGKNTSMTVKWKAISTAQGYQVSYSTSTTFKSRVTSTLSGKDAVTKTFKNLSRSCTYYVKVRSYTVLDGKKIFSEWSPAKTVKLP